MKRTPAHRALRKLIPMIIMAVVASQQKLTLITGIIAIGMTAMAYGYLWTIEEEGE
jgi:hypothetical protein